MSQPVFELAPPTYCHLSQVTPVRFCQP